MEEEKARKTQLKDFYRLHDPAREKNVDPIFAKFSYPEIYSAVLTKYGEVPGAWYAPRPARPQVPSMSRKPNVNTALKALSDDSKPSEDDSPPPISPRSPPSVPTPAAEPQDSSGLEITSPDDPELEKYKKMRKAGLPQGAVENCMIRDGFHPSCLYGDQVTTMPTASVPAVAETKRKSSKSRRKSRSKSSSGASSKGTRRPKPIPPTPPTPPEFMESGSSTAVGRPTPPPSGSKPALPTSPKPSTGGGHSKPALPTSPKPSTGGGHSKPAIPLSPKPSGGGFSKPPPPTSPKPPTGGPLKPSLPSSPKPSAPARSAAAAATPPKPKGNDPNDSLEMPPAGDEVYEKYNKMKKAGLPQGAIENCMIRDGIHPSGIFGNDVMTCSPKSAAVAVPVSAPAPSFGGGGGGVRKPPTPQGKKPPAPITPRQPGIVPTNTFKPPPPSGNKGKPKPPAPSSRPGIAGGSSQASGGGFNASENFASKKNLIASRLAGGSAQPKPAPAPIKTGGPSASVLEKQKKLASIFGGAPAASSTPTPASTTPKVKKWPVPTDTSVNSMATPQRVMGNQNSPAPAMVRPMLGAQSSAGSAVASSSSSVTGSSKTGGSAYQEMWSDEYQRPYYFNPYTGESLWEKPAGFGSVAGRGGSKLMVGKFDFRPLDPNNPNEMPIHAGDIVEVLEEGSDGWTSCKHTQTGKSGLVPSNYLGPM